MSMPSLLFAHRRPVGQRLVNYSSRLLFIDVVFFFLYYYYLVIILYAHIICVELIAFVPLFMNCAKLICVYSGGWLL